MHDLQICTQEEAACLQHNNITTREMQNGRINVPNECTCNHSYIYAALNIQNVIVYIIYNWNHNVCNTDYHVIMKIIM